MSFQQIRGAMQKLTSDALTAAGVPFAQHCFDNVQETPPADPAGTYAVLNLSFPQVVTETIGCDGADQIVGSANLLLYSPKRQGMKPAEDICQAVLKEWVRVNKAMVNEGGVHLRVRNINGPSLLAPDERPHSVVSLSCAFTARVD
jgi:hypothetical protein